MQFQENNKINTKARIIFILFFAFSFLMTSSTVFAQKKYVIVLDAGHGGKDPGNLGNGYREKNIALKVALEVGE